MSPQQRQVLSMLNAGPVCGTRFLKAYIPRYPARILELKQMGYVIEKRICRDEYHGHQSAQFIWRLDSSDQLALPV